MYYANEPFQHIYLVNTKLNTYKSDDFLETERIFSITLPVLQKIFLQTIGNGIYCDHIRIHTPQEIITNNRRMLINEETTEVDTRNGSIAVSLERIRTSVIIADSIDGDQIIIIPDEPEKLYVRLRGYGYRKICVVPRNFLDLMLWIDAEGKFESAAAFPYFTSWNGRKEKWLHSKRSGIMFAEVKRSIERNTRIQVHMQTSQVFEEGTMTTCFIPEIQGAVTFNEEAQYNTQIIDASCNIEYDEDFETLAQEIIFSIQEVGF